MEYNYSNEELLKMYYNLKRGRIFTLKMHEAVYGGLIRSSFHSPYGEEHIGVAQMCAITQKDWWNGGHRLQTALIMRYDMKALIAELFGHEEGLFHGSAFDYHLSDYTDDGARKCFGLGTLGGSVAMNTGFAWALKHQKKDGIVLISHGDGGCSEGAVYEAWNLAALYKVPAVYVIVNNGWAMTVPLKRQTANPNISDKAAACGLSQQIVEDGNDILAVRHALDIGVEKARNYEPNVVEIKTLRWEAHYIGQGNDYRDDKELIEDYKKNNDPLIRYEKYLLEKGVIDQTYIDTISAEISAEVDAAFEAGKAGSRPKFDSIYKKEYVYANPETGGDL